MLLQEAFLGQLHGEGQAALSAQGRQEAVRLFLQDDAAQGFQRQGLDINFIRRGMVGHDGCRVRVHQHHFQPCVLQGTAGLGTGIVELGSLTDDNGAGADNHHAMQFRIQRHTLFPPISAIKRSNKKRVSKGPPAASGWNWTEKAGISV